MFYLIERNLHILSTLRQIYLNKFVHGYNVGQKSLPLQGNITCSLNYGLIARKWATWGDDTERIVSWYL